MNRTLELFLQFVDALLLTLIFIFQSVTFNYYIIVHFNASSDQFLWFALDFICLLVFSLTLFLAFRSTTKRRNILLASSRTSIPSSSKPNSKQSLQNSYSSSGSFDFGFKWLKQLSSGNRTLGYATWLFYVVTIICKITVLFKAMIPQKMNEEDGIIDGPLLLTVALGVCSIVYWILLKSHHHIFEDDAMRNAYVKSVARNVAIEIFDSTSFLMLLITADNGGLLYSFQFENLILTLASINLLLPAITLYRLTMKNFGVKMPIEVIYNILHTILVDVTYLGVRIYLWRWFEKEASVFIMKNIYSVFTMLHSLLDDIKTLKHYFVRRKRIATVKNKRNSESIQQPRIKYLKSPQNDITELRTSSPSPGHLMLNASSHEDRHGDQTTAL